MTGSRPDKETARKMGMVPYDGAPPPNNGTYGGPVNNNGGANFTAPNSYNSDNPGSYSKVNNQTGGGAPFSGNSTGNYPDVPPGGFSGRSGNAAPANNGQQQLWSNGSGVKQGTAPTWPTNDQGAPMNGNSFQSRQGAPGASGPAPAGFATGGAAGGAAGGYVQPPQNGSGSGTGVPQQQQQPNWQGKGVSQGIPVNPGGNPNWQEAPANGHIDQGPQRRNVPKGDYVYYDGNGNQVQSNGAPAGPGPNEKHFHHHYYHNTHTPQQLPQQQQAGYPYNKKMEEKKKRSPAAAALAAALITCWACTCCCHVPCGF